MAMHMPFITSSTLTRVIIISSLQQIVILHSINFSRIFIFKQLMCALTHLVQFLTRVSVAKKPLVLIIDKQSDIVQHVEQYDAGIQIDNGDAHAIYVDVRAHPSRAIPYSSEC
jgi:hypothetical protein